MTDDQHQNGASPPSQGLPSQDARAAMERVLSGSTFAQATSLSKLLRYLVEETLAGRADRLKEYTLGVDVFERGEAFSPKTDTIVRVQARRLRAKLAAYYAQEGASDDLLIAVPKGQYVPNFRMHSVPSNGTTRPTQARAVDGNLDLTGVYRPDPKAHRLYVEGSRLSSRATPEALHDAIRHFEESIAIDPDYALSYAGISDAYLQLSSAHLPPHDAMQKARTAAERAIESDPSLDKAHAALGMVHLRYDWDRRAAEEQVKIAIALNPKSAEARVLYAASVSSEGRFSEALFHLQHAQELDPFSVKARLQTQFTYLLDRNYEAAIEEGHKTLQLEPGYSLGRSLLGLAYSLHGDVTTGLDHARLAADQEDSPWQNLFLQHGYALAGEHAQAEGIIRKLESMAARRYICAYEIGEAYTVMENKDSAFRWLERALDERADCMAWLEVEPWMDCLRDDTRYQEVVERLHRQPSCPIIPADG